MNAAELFVRCLENDGVDIIFGIPGEENLDMMYALLQSKMRFITTGPEQGAASLAHVAELMSQIEAQPDAIQLRLDLATQLVADDKIEAALKQLLEILKKNREWEEQLDRRTMIKVFDLLGECFYQFFMRSKPSLTFSLVSLEF